MKMPMELEALGEVSGAVIRKSLAIPTGCALLLAGGLIAGALVYSAVSQRYGMDSAGGGLVVRLDRMTGEVAACMPDSVDVAGGTGQQRLRFDCSGIIKRH